MALGGAAWLAAHEDQAQSQPISSPHERAAGIILANSPACSLARVSCESPDNLYGSEKSIHHGDNMRDRSAVTHEHNSFPTRQAFPIFGGAVELPKLISFGHPCL